VAGVALRPARLALIAVGTVLGVAALERLAVHFAQLRDPGDTPERFFSAIGRPFEHLGNGSRLHAIAEVSNAQS
jgi:hypothetical protein